jgi:hypothetical protein
MSDLYAAREEWKRNTGANPTEEVERIANLIHAIQIGDRPSALLEYLNDWLSKAHDRAALAGAPVAEAAPTDQMQIFEGWMMEVGDMDEGRGFSIEVEPNAFIHLTGLSKEDTREAANLYGKRVRITVSAAPAPQNKE